MNLTHEFEFQESYFSAPSNLEEDLEALRDVVYDFFFGKEHIPDDRVRVTRFARWRFATLVTQIINQ